MKETLRFKQLQLYKQPPKTKKKHIKLVIVSKTDDEVYVLTHPVCSLNKTDQFETS